MTEGRAGLEEARHLLAAWPAEPAAPAEGRVDVFVPPGELLSAVLILLNANWGFLSAITALDLGPEQDSLELLYHFCSGPSVVTVRLRLPRQTPRVQSLCGLLPSASVFEREVHEMFGIAFEESPDLSRLYLSDDWPAGNYPMLKDTVLPNARS